MMNEKYLDYIVTEKEYGIKLTEESLNQIEKSKPFLTDEQYQELFHYFNRTLLTARLHKAVSTAYFGYRIYAGGEEYQTAKLMNVIRESLSDIKIVSKSIQNYDVHPQSGQWNWTEQATKALEYYEWITQGT